MLRLTQTTASSLVTCHRTAVCHLCACKTTQDIYIIVPAIFSLDKQLSMVALELEDLRTSRTEKQNQFVKLSQLQGSVMLKNVT